MPRGARSTPLRMQGGRAVSARSKTGDPQCSRAMSVWVKARHSGAAVAAEVFRILGMCRAKARALKLSRDHALAGNELKSQVYAKRAERGMSGAERSRVAATKRAELVARRASKAAPAEEYAARGAFRHAGLGFDAKNRLRDARMHRRGKLPHPGPETRELVERVRARVAARAARKAPTPPPKPEPGFSLRQGSADGRKAFRTEDTGRGRTGTLFDMKRGDLPGQTSLLERVGSRESNPRAERYRRLGAHSLEVQDELARVRAQAARRKADERREKRARAEGAAIRSGETVGDVAARAKRVLKANRVTGADERRIEAGDRSIAPRLAHKVEQIQAARADVQDQIEKARAGRQSFRDELDAIAERGKAEALASLRGGKAPAGGHSVEHDAAAIHAAFRAHPGASRNFVQVADLRERTGLPRDRFDAAMDHLRRAGHMSLDSHEGLHNHEGLDLKRLREGAVVQGGEKLAWASIPGGAPAAAKGPTARQLARHLPKLSGGSPEAILEHGRRQIARRSKTAERLAQARAMRNEHEHPERHGRPDTPYQMDVEHIAFDPERFQYKLGAQGAHGTTDALKDVEEWNPKLAGIVSVWRDPSNGQTYVVNGHHRIDLAKRLGVGKVKVQYLDSPDAKHARAEGALTNIAEGRGTALDAAKFFRDREMTAEGAKKHGVSLKEHTARQGLAMANLEERIFRRVIDGDLSHERASIIGAAGLSHEEQRGLMKILDLPKNRKLTNGTVKNLADMARDAGTKTVRTRDLFGDNEEVQSLAVHRASLEDKIKRKLAEDHRLFGLVSKSKSAKALAERADTNVDTEKAGAISHEARSLLHFFDQLKKRGGPLSQSLNEGAGRLHGGEKADKVFSEHYAKARKSLKAMLEADRLD